MNRRMRLIYGVLLTVVLLVAVSVQGASLSGDSGTNLTRIAVEAGESDRNNRSDPPIAAMDERNVWRSRELSMLSIGMGVGDVTGDGANDVVLLGPGSVELYEFKDRRLTKTAEYTKRPLEFKSVDIADVRPLGGRPRIYVTAQNRGTIASFVLEYRDGKLAPVITDFQYYLRVIRYPTRGPILLGQRKGLGRVYEGPVYRLEDKGDELAVTGRFGVPLTIPIFGFCIGDFEGSRKPIIAVYDREEHLRLYRPSGKRMFTSQEYYGGTDVILRRVGPEEENKALLDEDNEREYCRPRMMAVDLNHDSVSELLVIAHKSKTGRYLSRMRMLGEGQVISLQWNGDSMRERWATPPIQGMITDFAIDKLPGLSGLRLITVERKKTDWLSFLSSKSQVRAYNVDFLQAEGGAAR